MTTFATRVTFDHVRNSAAGFTSANPTLGYGVTGLETDTGRIKVGDGVTPWNSLIYSTGAGVLSINSLTAQDMIIVGGSGVTVTPSSNKITIDSAGNVVSVNGQTGAVTITRVESLNGQTGTLTIQAGANVTVSTSASSITIAAGGGGSAPTTASISTVTASQNNWNIGTADISFIYSGITNTISVTGLATASNTLPRLVINGSTHTSASFTIKHNNTNSTAALRILVPWANDLVVPPNGGSSLFVYDNSQSRWRVV